MDYLAQIKQPIEVELADFIGLFNDSLTHGDGLLAQALEHIRQRGGKRMRPMLVLLLAKSFGRVNDATLNATVGLELLHTASLVHDDVVDESGERRGQPSVNASYNNKVAVLVGDFVLSTALLRVSLTHSESIVRRVAELGRTLSNGEILQLTNIGSDEISEEVYYEVIRQKTAALFETCAAVALESVGAASQQIDEARSFGQNLGMIFQIRDDIFDYFEGAEIGKPTGNDMREGKLTLPVIHALQVNGNPVVHALAAKVKQGTIHHEEIAVLIAFAKQNGGIDYARRRMEEIARACFTYIDSHIEQPDLATALRAYVEFVIQRNV